MGNNGRCEYLRAIYERYQKCAGFEKGELGPGAQPAVSQSRDVERCACCAKAAEKLLARTDINLEVNEVGWTPLHYVIELGILESAEWLLQHSADPNLKDKSGCTPLHLAVDGAADAASQRYVEHGISEIELGLIRLLLRHGADPSALSNDGQTPVSIAHDYGRSAVVELLRAQRPPQDTNG